MTHVLELAEAADNDLRRRPADSRRPGKLSWSHGGQKRSLRALHRMETSLRTKLILVVVAPSSCRVAPQPRGKQKHMGLCPSDETAV